MIKDRVKSTGSFIQALTVLPVMYTYLGTVHYLYPGLVPKRYGLGNQVFDQLMGWVKQFMATCQL
jgi:hypothetical protein